MEGHWRLAVGKPWAVALRREGKGESLQRQQGQNLRSMSTAWGSLGALSWQLLAVLEGLI